VNALLAPVLASLADPDPRIRAAAAETLAISRSPDATAALRNALADENIHVQLAAERSLQQISRAAPRCRGG
jgi:HEAT repeat protein